MNRSRNENMVRGDLIIFNEFIFLRYYCNKLFRFLLLYYFFSIYNYIYLIDLLVNLF